MGSGAILLEKVYGAGLTPCLPGAPLPFRAQRGR